MADEEDVGLSVFGSFCSRAARGQFPDLADRDGLWRLVARITARKAIKLLEHTGRLKRGGGRILCQSELDDEGNEKRGDRLSQVADLDPTPAFAVAMADECQRLLDGLGDETLRQIALGKVDGFTDEEIAEKLNCSRRTVLRKLDLIRKIWAGELAR
jgi:DNA-directed RNA polymerase specialized sigma24 family protein